MRRKRLAVLGLSAMLAVATMAFTAPAAGAHHGHPNIIVQVDKFIHKAERFGPNVAARYMLKIRRAGLHWRNQHGFGSWEEAQARDKGTGIYPRFVLRFECAPEYESLWVASRKVSKTGFRHYRGEATNYRWLDPVDRENRAFFDAKLFDRSMQLYDDALDGLFDCILDESRGPRWLKRLLF